MFNRMFQILELINMDIFSFEYRESMICASLIYLTLLEKMNLTNSAFIVENLFRDINSIYDYYDFNQIFNEFLVRATNFDFSCLIGVIQFCCRYFIVQESTDIHINRNNENSKTEEDFLQIQSENPNILYNYKKLYPEYVGFE